VDRDRVHHTSQQTAEHHRVSVCSDHTDIARAAVPESQKLYTWWSYRARDWAASNRGRRLDHIWTNETATPSVDLESYRIHLGWRGGWKPSDHAPISVDITV